MKKQILLTLLSLLLPMIANADVDNGTGTGFVGNGYYRIRNFATDRYLYVTDNKDYYDENRDREDFQAFQLWKDAYKAIYNPSSVIFIQKESSGSFDLKAQGTSLHSLVDWDWNLAQTDDGYYTVYAAKEGHATKYLSDDRSNSSDQGQLGTKSARDYRKWIVDKIETNSATNYVGIKPTIALNGKFYHPFYADFPFRVASLNMHVYYINNISACNAFMQEIEGEIPAKTPVIIECTSTDPSQNRIELLNSTSAEITGNKLSGVYFCNGERPKESIDAYTEFDSSTMRLLTVADGKLVMSNSESELLASNVLVEIETVDWNSPDYDDIYVVCIPANTCYLKADATTPAELDILFESGMMTEEVSEIADIFYKLNNDEKVAEVTYSPNGDKYYEGDVVIPSTITYNDETYHVTAIGKYAFGGCGSLTSVTIPNSVTTIAERAFESCSSLTSVTIPNSVTSIGVRAFRECYLVTDHFINSSTLTSSDNWGAILCDEETSDGLLIKNHHVVKCRPWATNVTIPSSVTSINDYAFRSCSGLTSITIPNSVTSIGNYAFYDCIALTSITSFIEEPFAINYVFNSNTYNTATLYVPAVSIEAYQSTNGWNDFKNIEIIGGYNIIISLPKGTNVQNYSMMWLELTNNQSSQKIHYVITDRTTYTFAGIAPNTLWNVVLRNEHGNVFGKIEDIEVKDENVSVTFTSLAKPQSVVLSVLTPNGQNVTAQTQITWTDASGNYLAQSASLTALPAGYQVSYRVVLPQDLAMLYVSPQQVDYVLTDDNNNLICKLDSIPQVHLSGKVKDAATGLPLSGAIVSASQTFGGKYSKTLNAKTDKDGVFMLKVANVPTTMTFSASDYVSQTIDITDHELLEMNELEDVLLKSISGAIISLDFTYTTCDGETQDWYSDYNNVSYTLYNTTKQQAISQFNVQYPQIVLLEEVEDGDVLKLTASSRTSAFMPVETTAIIAEQKAIATFAIKELGQIQASFATTGNTSVVSSLYDASGKLVKTYNYFNASLTICDLADGQYTLVSMGSSRWFNTIYDLAQLPQTGLVKGTDYVESIVEVRSGVISQITIDEVPMFDESKLYYTGNNTSFTVNKPSIVVGNYLTLTGRIDFKPAYATSASNVNLIVDLPESCEFVENSVMVGNSTSSYILNGNQITIPVVRYTDRVRFCVIPTLGGDYAPSAFAQFDLNGETITQPIGSANYTAKGLSINVPSTVAKTSVPISGTALGASSIDIYDNDVLIGQTTSLANGTWATTCELNEPYNLSMHSIYAKEITKSGLELQSETKECQYDINAIIVSKVHMLYNYKDIVFDFLNPSMKSDYYSFVPSRPEFTFIVDFTDNDTTKISNVVVYAKTSDNTWTPMNASYNENKHCWVTSGKFDSSKLPVNVSVDYDYVPDLVLDAEYCDAMLQNFETIKQEMQEETSLDVLNACLEESMSKDDIENTIELINEILTISEGAGIWDAANNLEEEAREQLESEIGSLSDSIFIAYNTMIETSIYANDILAEYMDGLTINEATGIDVNELLCRGFECLQKTDGTMYYILYTDKGWEFVDFQSNLYVIAGSSTAQLRKAFASNDGAQTTLETIRKICIKLEGIVNDIMNSYEYIIKTLTEIDIKTKIALAIELGELEEAQRNGSSKVIIDAIKAKISKNTAVLRFNYKIMKAVKKCGPLLGKSSKFLSKGLSLIALVNDAWNGYRDAKRLLDIIESTSSPCNEATAATNELLWETKTAYWLTVGFYIPKIGLDIASLLGLSGGVMSLIPSGGSSLTVILGASAAIGINVLAECGFNWKYKRTYSRIKKERNSLYKFCSENNTIPNEQSDFNDEPGVSSGNADAGVSIDPSGYVYEGVPSNRLQGVTATAYYKEMVEDMYGDLYENVVKWDAAEYAQENPLFTDEYGMYQWDVPQGLWQVKFEKEGYETTYSDWLPVPPPQLDINIAMKQARQPEVREAHAYEDGVEISFDKYMMPEQLNTDNIFVRKNGKDVKGDVMLMDEETTSEGGSVKYASRVRFVPEKPFNAGMVTLFVANRVRSYADIPMQDNYEQTFTIEKEVKEIVADSLVKVLYGRTGTIIVEVHPADAAAGKTLNVKTSSPMILGVEAEQVTIDEDGKATITVSGELPGTAALTFSVEGTDKTALTIVNVEHVVYQQVATPTASIASGSSVKEGTEIFLSCATEGATIYYTLDGSCPCDENGSRMVYDGTPIIAIGMETIIKAMAVAPGMVESEVAEFVYIVKGTGIEDISLNDEIQIYPLPVHDKLNVTAGGKMIKNVTISSMSGLQMASSAKHATKVTLDVSRIAAGIYIVNVTTEEGHFSRKILKGGCR